MATCNFIETANFPLWAIDDEFSDENGGFDQFRYEIWEDCASELIEAINNGAVFHRARLEPGYYCGVQIVVDEFEPVEDLDNGETQCLFGMCRSETVRKYRSEIRRINKRLDANAPKYGFAKYGVSARFSNGETWYHQL